MATKIKLTDFVSEKDIEKVSKIFYENHGFDIEVVDVNGREIVFDRPRRSDNEFCELINSFSSGKSRCRQERVRSLNSAIETGQPYVTICHAGILLGCVPVMEGNLPLGGLFYGKCLCEPVSDGLCEDISKRLQGVVSKRARINEALEGLPLVSTRKLQEASDFLFILFYQITGLDPRVVNWRRERSDQQSQIGELIAEQKQQSAAAINHYEYERKLLNKVRIGDRTETREILNLMLASIMLGAPGDIDVLKARMLELISVLSRAASEGGVDINLLLKKNLNNITRLMKVETQQDLCTWVGRAVDDFIELVHSKQDSRRISQIRPAIEYIEANYDKPISLSDVARSTHLSVSRLAHIFKEQAGVTIVDYITNVRIEMAKNMLIGTNKTCTEICFEVGYNNQSYFTRTFKDLTGMTPRQFRNSNRTERGK
ncbi:MAG: helix-turn-helix domain-containing protein [Sedimentisphaeraceae bacterium JB056]